MFIINIIIIVVVENSMQKLNNVILYLAMKSTIQM